MAVSFNSNTQNQCAYDPYNNLVDHNKPEHRLNINNLMPGNWDPDTCTPTPQDRDEMHRSTGPTKASVSRTSGLSGLNRTSMTTRSPNARIMGLSNPLRASIAPYISNTCEIPFNNSDAREYHIKNTMR